MTRHKKNHIRHIPPPPLRNKLLKIAVVTIIVLVASGTLVFHYIEWLHRFDAFYFVMMTMSTIGYGDIVPTTYAGKVMAIIYACSWVPLFVYTMWLFVERRFSSIVHHYIKHSTHQAIQHVEERVEKMEEEQEELKEELVENKMKHMVKTVVKGVQRLVGIKTKKPSSITVQNNSVDTDKH